MNTDFIVGLTFLCGAICICSAIFIAYGTAAGLGTAGVTMMILAFMVKLGERRERK